MRSYLYCLIKKWDKIGIFEKLSVCLKSDKTQNKILKLNIIDGVSDQEMNCELFVFLIKFVNRK